MPLAANSKLGPYEIKSTLGVGGMGEVYRARDSRLNRDVAIKVLREDGSSPDLRSRFEREARAVAALNHPNIIAVHDFGIEAGQQYIVSELLEGESLRALLGGKPVPVRKLIDIAAQVVDGLAAAHSAGIVHRDLKPENIMLTKDGRAKILDFGLARHAPNASSSGVPPGSDETFVPDTQNLTSAGSILGTAAYMSPEQALGQETDYRSDQFSFGLILYEMASGKQAFAKPNSIETMAAIVREEPPSIEEKLPPPLKWIIDRCLQKEPNRRYESTRDLCRDLQNLRDHFAEVYTSGTFAPVTTPAVKAPRWKFLAICAGCISLGALLVYILKPSGQDVGNFRYTPIASDAGWAAWSQDGKAIAYSTRVSGIYQTFVRYLNNPAPAQLTHGKHGALVQGWSSDNSHLIVLEYPDDSGMLPMYSVATVGGEPEFIMKLDCETACILSEDGTTFVTRIRDKDGYFRIATSSPLGSPLKTYSPDPFASKAYFSNPTLAFTSDGKQILYSFFNDKGVFEHWLLPYPAGSGSPRRVLPGLPPDTSDISWMPDGRHVLISSRPQPNTPFHLATTDLSSRVISPLTTGTASEINPVASPDGKSILYTQQTHQEDVVSVSLLDGTTTTLISSGRWEATPAWSAQGKLIWATDRSGLPQLWMRLPDGSERPVVTAAEFPKGGVHWMGSPLLSPDNERLIYIRSSSDDTAARLWISSMLGGSPVRLTGVQAGGEAAGAWSQDGSRYVYLQSQAGKQSLMVTKTTGNATPVLLKDDLYFNLSDWSPTGDWITYRDKTGWNLISPDGKRSKFLGKIETAYLAFSKDGKLLYGVHVADNGTATLFSLDIATLNQTTIKELGKDFIPAWDYGARFSLAPDGKSLVYSVSKDHSDLWMLTGYRQPGLWNQIKDAFHFSPTK